ncbi:17260_t:CDS:2 [Acaulospora morrowiae]|uniref:17260_t:CDS:1 n=1 Tax=Acaulospora morrowiae TaxID=94023 RepID=A0A9N8VHS9_9GLOM|nr:17260_t:CDS:2 [Acaulospora morrowiae]
MSPVRSKKLKTYQRKRRFSISPKPFRRRPITKPSQLSSRRRKVQEISKTLNNAKNQASGSDSDVFVKGFNRRGRKPNNIFPVADVIDYDLKVLFVSLFSGKKSMSTGHHFSSSLNHFYDCLVESGLTGGVKVNYLDDRRLARDFKLGIVTLICRPENRLKKKLSIDAISGAIPNLIKKVEMYHPRYLCFMGKSGYEALMEFRIRSSLRSRRKKSKDVKWGLQPTIITWNGDNHPSHTKIFVTMSTSERTGKYSKEELVSSFKELNKLLFKEKFPQIGKVENGIYADDESYSSSEHLDMLNACDDEVISQGFLSHSNGYDVPTKHAKQRKCNKIEKDIIGAMEELQCDMEINYHEEQDQCIPSFHNNNLSPQGEDFMKVPSQNYAYSNETRRYSVAFSNSKVYSWICQVHDEMNGDKGQGSKLDFTPPKSFKAMKW